MSETLEAALPQDLDRLAEQLMHRLCECELRIATAESCTGGLFASLLTDIQGAGHGFDRGFVTYTEEAKAELLGIDPDVIRASTAVSEVVARRMADGALAKSGADLAISVTGYAGRGGGEQAEEGLVHFGLAERGGGSFHRMERFGAIGRGPVRSAAIGVMLEMFSDALDRYCAAREAQQLRQAEQA